MRSPHPNKTLPLRLPYSDHEAFHTNSSWIYYRRTTMIQVRIYCRSGGWHLRRYNSTTRYGRSPHSLTRQIYGMFTQRHYNSTTPCGRSPRSLTRQIYGMYTQRHYNNSIWQVTVFTNQANIWYVYTETLQLNNSIWQVTAFTNQANIWYVYNLISHVQWQFWRDVKA